MSSRAFLIVAAAAVATGSLNTAHAADLPMPAPAYAPVQEFSGWYLRGDIGMTNQRVKSADNALIASATDFTWLDHMSFDSGMLFGLGAGYTFNNWLRADVTGQYRGKTALRGLDSYYDTGDAATYTNNYTGNKSEWLFLVNAYVDLGTWWCITPFVGAGVGFSHVTFNNFRDDNIIAGGGGYAGPGSKTNFAWALHAGLGYQISKNVTAEVAYSYVNLGDQL
jgi:opacity protein-like surface antigen